MDSVELPPDGGTEEGVRVNFVRGPDGTVRWFRFGGRLFHRGAPSAAARGGPRATTFNPRSLLS